MNRFSNLKTFFYMILLVILVLLLSGCAKQEKITFSAEIESISENSIIVKTINYDNFDKACVDLKDAKYDFELSEGQIVDLTILPEIRESYPVQVTGVKLELVKEAELKITDYYPIEADTRYVYEGTGNEFAGYSAFVDYTSENKVQLMIDNGGTSIARTYEIKGGKVIRTLSKGEVYYRENLLDQNDANEEVLLMEPLKKGTSWLLEDGRKREITEASAEVATPMGNYSAIEVTTDGKDGTDIDYYVKGIGLVKTVFQTGGMEVSTSLKSVEKNATRVQSVNFYYPDVQNDKIYFVPKDITYHTNDNTSQLLEDAYKQTANENYDVVLPTGAAIKSLTLNKDNKVRVDLNNSFISGINAGSGYEGMILQCIANTFGQYYNSSEVILTVGGEPYQSGHVMMKEGQSIPVKYDGTTEKKD